MNSSNVTSFYSVNNNSSIPSPKPEWHLEEQADFDGIIYFQDLNKIVTEWTEDSAFYPTTVVYSLAFIIGIFGNGLVVYGLLIDKKAQNVTNTFLVSLAIADLLFLLLIVPYDMTFKFAGYWSGVRVFCKLSAFIEMLSAAATIWNLTAVSVERYIVIVHPLRSRSLCSLGKTRKIIVVVWCLAAILSIPCLFVYDTETYAYYNETKYAIDCRCVINESQKPGTAWYQMSVMFLIPTMVMMFCYSLVIKVLWHSTQELAQLTQENRSSQSLRSLTNNVSSVHQKNQSNEMMEARKQVIRMLLAIISVFLICWGPKLTLQILKSYACGCLHNNIAFIAMIIINLLPYLQSASNPIIYSFMSKNFRQSMRTAFNTCCPILANRKQGSPPGIDNSYQGYRTVTSSFNDHTVTMHPSFKMKAKF